jgi:hypothetical protein
VASGEDVLNDAVFWVDAGRSSVSSGALTNLGTGGSALNAVFGNTTGTDSFDPALLTHTGTNYLYLPGVTTNYSSTPDAAALDVTGDIEIVMRVAPDSWTPTAEQYLVGKYFTTTSQRSFALSMTTTGRLALRNSVDGINGIYRESAVSGLSAGIAYWIKVTLDVDTGSNTNLATFSYAADQTTEPSSWTTLSSTTTTVPATTTTSIYSGSAALEVGSIVSGANSLAGKVYRCIVRNGIDGTTVFDADFTTGITSGAQTTFTESSANAATVTINRATSGRKSVAVVRPILLFGTDDYLEVADNNLLDFGASEPFTAMVATRQWATITSQGVPIAKKTGNGSTGTGWLIRNGVGTPADTVFDTYDGTTATNRTMPTSKTSGTLAILTGVASASQLTAYYNGTASAATTRQAGSYANSEVMRIGRLSGASTQYVDMELVAAAVWRRALNANEIATIVNRYT